MRLPIFGLLFAALLFAIMAAGAAGPPAEETFEQGIKALAAKDWDKALGLFEAELAADPDNLRYGSEYRQAALVRARTLHAKEGQPQDFDRPIKFFERLLAKSPGAANDHLNYGFVFVDKIPAAGAITQVILANTALGEFTKSLELRPSWIGYYTRGVSYLFWPKIFGRAKLGVEDLEAALKMQKAGPKKPYYVRAWVALGDGYWKTDEVEKARSTWRNGLKDFPGDSALKERLSKQGDDLKALIEDALDPNKRVDTNLKDLWENP
jgi:tetratricopeptide (TPR) repeat protein